MRFTWDPVQPYPYESGWLLFVKLMAHNFCSPKVMAQAIAKPGFVWNGSLDFRDSSWIDITHLAAALNVSPDRLRTCFLDQLGFPPTTPVSDEGIRICPHCLSMGYHSVFFGLGMIEVCPVHKTKLERSCHSCARAVMSSGLRRYAKSEDLSSTFEAPSDYLYGTACKHIRFDPERISWACDRVKQSDLDEWKGWGDRLLEWWGRATQTTGAIPEVVTSAGRTSVDGNAADLANRLGFAESIGGKCPWPLVVDPPETEVMSWKRPFRFSNELDRQLEERLLLDTYRVVRRHIYRRYVKSHRHCWNSLSKLGWLESKALSSASACAVALAYAAWRMAIEGFSNMDRFNKPIERTGFVERVPPMPVDERGAYSWWYAYFFGILADIDKHLHRGHFYIDRQVLTSWRHPIRSKSISWSTMTDENHLSSIRFQHCWLVFPNRRRLMVRAETRCLSRPNGQDAMLDGYHAYSLSNWSWTGHMSEFSRGACMFKLRDTSSLRRSSRIYEYLRL